MYSPITTKRAFFGAMFAVAILPALVVLATFVPKGTEAQSCSLFDLNTALTQVTLARQNIQAATDRFASLRNQMNQPVTNMVRATVNNAANYISLGDMSDVLRQVSRGDLLSMTDTEAIIDSAILDAISAGVLINPAQVFAIRASAITQIRARTSQTLTQDVAAVVASNIVATTGSGSAPAIAALIGPTLNQEFENGVLNSITSRITNGMTGGLDAAQVKALVSLNVANVTGYSGSLCSGSGDTFACYDLQGFLNANLSDQFMQALVPLQETFRALNAVATALTSAITAVTSAVSEVTNSISNSASLTCTQISNILNLSKNIQRIGENLMTQVNGPLATAIANFAAAANAFVSTGDASAMLASVNQVNASLGQTQTYTERAADTTDTTSSGISNETASQGGGANQSNFRPFGGMIQYVYFCTCSYNYMITIGGPVGGVFMYQPGGTILYQYSNILSTGSWALGLTQNAQTACVVYIGTGCSTIGQYPPMYMVGTSM